MAGISRGSRLCRGSSAVDLPPVLSATMPRSCGWRLALGGLPAGGRAAGRDGAVRLRRRSPEHQSAAHLPSARPPGAALRAAHHARPLRLGARAAAVPGARAGPGRPIGGALTFTLATGRALARRRTDHGARRPLDARRRARSAASAIPGPSELAELQAGRGARTTRPSYSASPLRSARFPDVLTDLAMLPAHLLDTVPRDALRQAAWNESSGRQRAVPLRARTSPTAAGCSRPTRFPAALGGPPRLERLIVVVVDEPATKLAALTAGELDFAGIQPGPRGIRRAATPRSPCSTIRCSSPMASCFNTRRPPFDRLAGGAQARRGARPARRSWRAISRLRHCRRRPAGRAPGALGIRRAAAPDSLRSSARARGAPLPSLRAAHRRERRGAARADGPGAAGARRVRGHHPAARAVGIPRGVYGPAHDFDAAVLGIPGDVGLGYLGPLAALSGMTAPADPAAAQRLFADSMPVAFLYHARGLQGMNRRVHGVHMDLRGELVTVHNWWVAR